MGKATTELPPPMTMTVTQQKKKKRDLAMLEGWITLMKEDPKRSRVLLRDYLMRRFGFASVSGYHYAMQRALTDPDTPASIVREYERLKNNR